MRGTAGAAKDNLYNYLLLLSAMRRAGICTDKRRPDVWGCMEVVYPKENCDDV